MKEYIRHKKGLFIVGILVTTLTVITESIFALVMREIIDSISTQSEALILGKLPIYLIYILVMISFSFINSMVITKCVQQIMVKMKRKRNINIKK